MDHSETPNKATSQNNKWRVIPIHDWLELVLVNCPTSNPENGNYPNKMNF